ncbi:MAG: type II/IV secretion system protein [Candidatus Vogelbacteria bacterium]|nr:type II/IV secretion system protein [Candidatus Vogelbacteria bacterium]
MAAEAITQELARGGSVSIINLVNCLISQAAEVGASDLHLDPSESGLEARLRIDGVLEDLCHIPKEIKSEVVSRIKVVAGLRTDEHQMPQDGRFRHLFPNQHFVDIRVSIAPTYHGENVVLRLLSDKAEDFSLGMLGFSESDQVKIGQAIKKSSGMILVTGPTGSGKTTTLYTLIKMLNSKSVSIITVEDPIEYAICGIKQIQVNPRAGLTFVTGLRTILRQDPNIIMVGEIRDVETASMAVNTALTGHLLLSTLHTNDAATTLPRLLDMKIESFLVASTVSVAIGQRLVRRICSKCKEKIIVTPALAQSLAAICLAQPILSGEIFYRGKGCEYCHHSGYTGRLVINEVLVATPNLREAILNKASASRLKQIAITEGMTTMIDDGFIKARSGQTTIEEVLRVIHE